MPDFLHPWFRPKLDIHIQTAPASRASSLDLPTLRREILSGPRGIGITDPGSIQGYQSFRLLYPDIVAISGVSLATDEGTFLVYSEDFDYLRSLPVYGRLRDFRRDGETAVIWSRPSVDGWGKISRTTALRVAPFIDGVEVYNGQLLFDYLIRRKPFRRLTRQLTRCASEFRKARTAGSGALGSGETWRAWTESRVPIGSTRDFIEAVKQRETVPVLNRFFPNEVIFFY